MSAADVLDVVHSLTVTAPTDAHLLALEDRFVEAGMEMRERLDPGFQKKNWGMSDNAAANILKLVRTPAKKQD